MQEAGYEYKAGKQPAFRTAGQKKFTRLRSLGDEYSEDEIRAVIIGLKPMRAKRKRAFNGEQEYNLVIDIQARLQAGKGAGFERWAKTYNAKQFPASFAGKTWSLLLPDSAYHEPDSVSIEASGRNFLFPHPLG